MERFKDEAKSLVQEVAEDYVMKGGSMADVNKFLEKCTLEDIAGWLERLENLKGLEGK